MDLQTLGALFGIFYVHRCIYLPVICAHPFLSIGSIPLFYVFPVLTIPLLLPLYTIIQYVDLGVIIVLVIHSKILT